VLGCSFFPLNHSRKSLPSMELPSWGLLTSPGSLGDAAPWISILTCPNPFLFLRKLQVCTQTVIHLLARASIYSCCPSILHMCTGCSVLRSSRPPHSLIWLFSVYQGGKDTLLEVSLCPSFSLFPLGGSQTCITEHL